MRYAITLLLVLVASTAHATAWIEQGTTDQEVYFTAYDSTDPSQAKTGLTGFTVRWSKAGGADTAMNSPTVAEIDNADMPGVYALTIGDGTNGAMTTITTGVAMEQVCLQITNNGMLTTTVDYVLHNTSTSPYPLTAGQSLAVLIMALAGLSIWLRNRREAKT